MNSRLLLIISAFYLGILGIILTFVPDEAARFIGMDGSLQPVALQVTGALYFGFAMLNWLSRGNPVGGIYNRPLAMANFSHFMIAMFALLKASFGTGNIALWLFSISYIAFTAVYGYVLFTHPAKTQ